METSKSLPTLADALRKIERELAKPRQSGVHAQNLAHGAQRKQAVPAHESHYWMCSGNH